MRVDKMSPAEIQHAFACEVSRSLLELKVDISYWFEGRLIGDAAIYCCSFDPGIKWEHFSPFSHTSRKLRGRGIGTLATILPLEIMLERKIIKPNYYFIQAWELSSDRMGQYSRVGLNWDSGKIPLPKYLSAFKDYAIKKGFNF